MCGICGVVQVGGVPRQVLEQETLDRMTDIMRHRGPSDRGTYLADGVALGVRRLSIVDVAGGHQPVTNEDGSVWTVHNGELYNHLELRRGLESAGHRLRSRCDTEVIPHLYERDGDSFPARLRGMFGIAVWDERRRRLVLVRDRLGIKPLYYARHEDLLVFASELKSLLQSGLVERELDYDAIDAYLTLGYFPAPLTPLAGVRKLEPGHRLVIDDEIAVERYWAYPKPQPVEMTAEEASERVLAKLEESVRLRLMSDVPLGAMLSGGIDSSLVVALMARNMSEPVKTFSVGFREDSASELADARFVAEYFGTDHTELELSFLEDAVPLDDLVWHLDEPLADLSPLGFDALCRLAAEDVTVTLSGQGADELYGGYRKHRAAWALGALGHLPGPIVRGAARVGNFGPDVVRRTARTVRANGPAERLLAMSGDVDANRRRTLFRGPLAETDGTAATRAIAAYVDGLSGDPLAETLFLDGQLALPDLMLHYFDRTSMAHSLEVRVPFLDHELVELSASIPSRYKVRRWETKVVLRQLAGELLPPRVLAKPKVGFFVGAADEWLRTRLSVAMGERLLGHQLRCEDFLDRATLDRLVTDFLERRSDAPRARLLLSVLMLETWLSSYLERASMPPVAGTT
ncbi:MAG: asparagine synthase (glutamine-hydrolyzing) [Actinobacteria bacterium]|nr:asparagine synthase (glutamine-hydrolyzing) [Actinomycetota bacterium]